MKRKDFMKRKNLYLIFFLILKIFRFPPEFSKNSLPRGPCTFFLWLVKRGKNFRSGCDGCIIYLISKSFLKNISGNI